MARIPLFIHSPVSESVMQALPFIEGGEEFRPHPIKTDPDLFGLMIDVRPCVALFSIPGPEETRRVCSLLESFRLYRSALGYPSRDPTLRIILVAEQRAVAIERWHELGVHEFVIAPILPRALSYKTQRHYQRAIASRIPEPVIDTSDEILIVPANPSSGIVEPIEFRRVQTPLAPIEEVEQVIHFAAPKAADRWNASQLTEKKTEPLEVQTPPQQFRMIATIPDLNDPEGRWEKTPSSPNINGDQDWDWAWYPPKDKQSNHTYKFRGERPVFDRKRGGWQLRGQDPELVLATKQGQRTKVISVEEVAGSKQVMVHESIDVHEIVQESYKRNLAEGGSETSDFRRTSRGQQGLSSAASPQTRASSQQDETIAPFNTRGVTQPLNLSSTQAGSRTLISDRARDRLWRSPTSSESTNDQDPSSSDEGTSNEEDPLRTESTSGFPRTTDPDRDPGSQSKESNSDSLETNPPRQKERSSSETSVDEQGSVISEGAEENLDPQEMPEPTGDETSDLHADGIENDPLIARLEAALLGKSDVPRENLAAGPEQRHRPQVSSGDIEESFSLTYPKDPAQKEPPDPQTQTSEKEDVIQYRALQKRNPFPAPENKIRLNSDQNQNSSRIQNKMGSDSDPKSKDLKLKTSGTEETNTWSMQNLDETEGLGKAKRSGQPVGVEDPSKTLIDSLLSESKEETSEQGQRAGHVPMDPEEKARLLRSIYASMDLSQKAPDIEKPEQDSGFLERILEAIRSLFKNEKQ